MSGSNFTRRLSEFKDKFSRLLGPKVSGYDELSTLERPLVADDHQESDDYQRQHGVRPSSASYQPPAVGGEQPAQFAQPVALPSQDDEIREISVLAKDAAEILWEMHALGEHGSAVADMHSKAEQLQAQLRGLISDYQGGDEGVMAQAFEAFDMLSRCLEEIANPSVAAPAAAAGAAHVPALAPPPGAAAPAAAPATAAAPASEAPLISFE